MLSNNNELKIELNPENLPISELEKESIDTLINKDTLGYSFDINQKLGYLAYKVPVLSGFFKAYCNHYPIRIKPDDIWLLIIQCFSYHVNENSQKLRNYFVNFDGQQKLEIKIECEKIEKEHLEIFVKEVNKKMKDFLGNELLENLIPNFTTTDNNSKLVCQISILNTFQKYFRYFFNQINCGIPYIILEGTSEDYKKIILKAKNLRKYDFEWYIDRIIPIIEKMVEAKEGKIDINFFKNIIQNEEVIEKRYQDCSLLRYKINYIDGWIVKFFGYIKNAEGNLVRFINDKIEGEEINNLPNQILNAPFIIRKEDNSIKNMKFEAGFFGCEQNEKKEVNLSIGWLVSPLNSVKKGKKDVQFKNEYVSFFDRKEMNRIMKLFNDSKLNIENEKDDKISLK